MYSTSKSDVKSQSDHAVPLRPAYRFVLFALLILIAGEVLLSSRQQSQVFDEADHLYAGYQYWKHADFGRNPEHPPLAKLIAASSLLPLQLAEPRDPAGNFKYRDFSDGAKFLYTANADQLLARGRGMLLIFTLGLSLAIFASAREMFSAEAGLLATTLFCFEPVLLGNAGLILTDITLSCLMFTSVYAFYRYLKHPTSLRLILCSISVGLTLAAKQSGIFIFPILAILTLTDAFLNRTQSDSSPLQLPRRKIVVALAVIAFVSYTILWAFYAFRYTARPNGLALTPTLPAYAAVIPNRLEASAITFCGHYHLLPEAYLYGWADILQVPGVRNSFILGNLHTGSWVPGFPVIILVKTTLTLLVLILLIPFTKLWQRRHEFFFLAIPAVLYLLVAIASRMNAEVRYVLPVYPFVIVLAGAAAWDIARRSRPGAIIITALLVFAATSSLHAFPNYLPYANEAFGGPAQSYRLMSGTNGDAGQSLKSVKLYLDQNHITNCWFDYVDPFVNPAYYGIPCKPLISESASLGYPYLGPVPPVISGTVLISATEAATNTWEPDALNPYAQFTHLQPDAKPGNTVLAFRGTFNVPLLAAYSHSLASKSLATQGKLADAVAEAQLAASLAPGSATMQANLGLILMQAGRTHEGQQVNATALRLARASNSQYQLQLIRLLQQPGMTQVPSSVRSGQ